MGVTRGGILVPTPIEYDYGTPSRISLFPRPTVSAGSSIRHVTRVPPNPNIDDFEAIYFCQASAFTSAVTFDIVVTNLRTSQVIASTQETISFVSAFNPYKYAISKTNPFIPGDFIEVVISHVSGGTLEFNSYCGPSESYGFSFPQFADSAWSFGESGIFFTWLDSDLNQIVEWMPGQGCENPTSIDSGGRYFGGNRIVMPFTDRRPSGVWSSQYLDGGEDPPTIKIFADPADNNDFTELYSISYPSLSGSIAGKFTFWPFDGDQPTLERGRAYIVGFGDNATIPSTPRRFWLSRFVYQSFGLPDWTIGPPRPFYGFTGLTQRYRVTTLGTWLHADDPLPGQNPAYNFYSLGFVFEESEA